MTLKIELRTYYKKLRGSISDARRKEAAQYIFEQIQTLCKGPILSFASFGSEIDLSVTNRWLSIQKKLVLPRVEGASLHLYLVENLDDQLETGPGVLRQPVPQLCKPMSSSGIACALIPGLAFDEDYFRLGYGKGHYDRFLAAHPIHSIGVGFREQKSIAPLPRDPWDIPVEKLLLG